MKTILAMRFCCWVKFLAVRIYRWLFICAECGRGRMFYETNFGCTRCKEAREIHAYAGWLDGGDK